MAKSENIPVPAVRRLSFCLRQLEAFNEDNRTTVSSREFGEALGQSDAQVRKDLAYSGQFGHRGSGTAFRS
jgi:redox-sensing transcriptional repressor